MGKIFIAFLGMIISMSDINLKNEIKGEKSKFSLLQGNWISINDKDSKIKIDQNYYYDFYGKDFLTKSPYGIYNTERESYDSKIDLNGKFLCVFEKGDDYTTVYQYEIMKISEKELTLFYINSGKTIHYRKTNEKF
jgi:hypothetical protein